MGTYIQTLSIKLAVLILITPICGYGLMRGLEFMEKQWKSNNRKRKWLATCCAFLILEILSGFLL